MTIDLGLDDAELSTCVACGLCLPHCPTFRATGEEALSPRGRIDAMRGVQWRGADADDEFVRFMETCVQCRGCEPACPSGVPFGHLMERHPRSTRRTAHDRPALAARRLRRSRPSPPAARRVDAARRRPTGQARAATGRTLQAADPARPTSAVDRRRRLAVHGLRDGRLDAPDAPVRRRPRDGGRIDVRGARPDGCCGALHVHAGLVPDARRLAERIVRSMPGDAPILVDSAGCGAAMKDYGRLLGTARGRGLRRHASSTSTSGSPSASTGCRSRRSARP